MPVHPYIPNSVPKEKEEMLKEIGVKRVDDLFASIPPNLMTKAKLDLPSMKSEYEVRKHVESILSKNVTTNEVLSFLGAGCWPHFVPAVCDEINSRSEFVTAYTGDVYSDLGRYQALFEFQSLIGDLVAKDAVPFPVYDGAIAATDSIRMALAVTGRKEILVPSTMQPSTLNIMKAHCEPDAKVLQVGYDSDTGLLNIDNLKEKLSSNTAAVFIENPGYLGIIETQVDAINDLAHDAGALFVVGVEPISLGILRPPGEYGADIVCGEGQPLGMHMSYGGALLGFIACSDDESLLAATGHRIITLTKTKREGEWGFGYVLPERSMFGAREKAITYTGTATALWAITAAVYMSLLGPQGIRELAEVILGKTQYAMRQLSQLDGINSPVFQAQHFKDFTVNFDDTGLQTKEIDRRLLEKGIQGGKDLSSEHTQLGNTSLYCVTEIHTKEEIDRLVATLEEVLS
jgi:glycine dehydrogenase subunit 1